MAQITINGKEFYLQDFVQNALKLLLKANAISQIELKSLMDSDYCKDTFDLNYPLLSTDKNSFASDSTHLRYYTEEIGGYYICNHWVNYNGAPFLNWFLSFLQGNNIQD